MFTRLFDIVASVILLVCLSPLIGLTALVVLFSLGRPVLFRQKRPGLHERLFDFLKFRTMTDKRDQNGDPLPDHERLTKTGEILRSASLDELPQLWNVLRGEMSIVGPRPLLPEYLPLYSPRQRSRQFVKPGITGWAQVNGRNSLSWEEKFELDAWYVEHQSVWLNLKILWMTALTVIRRDGIRKGGHATMPRFSGSTVR